MTPADFGQEPSGDEVGDFGPKQVLEEDSTDEDNSDRDEALKELIKRKVDAMDNEGNEQTVGTPKQPKHTSTNTRLAANGCVVPNGGNLIIPTTHAGSQEAVVLQSNDEQ